MKSFNYKDYLPKQLYDRLCEMKINAPEIIEAEAIERKKRFKLTKDGKLVLVASDHNARMITEYDGDPIRLGDRYEFLARILRILSSPEVDGIEGTPDILEDLLILNNLSKQLKGIDFLKNKLMIGTINRGGLKGTCWEMDDMSTCFTIDRILRLKLDGVKFMFRIDINDSRSGKTIKYCADAVSEASKYNLPVFIECLYVNKTDTGYSMDTSTNALIKVIGVASALGSSAARKWLEVPINEEYNRVTLATTCPILVVPEESARKAEDVVKEYQKGLGEGNNVRGTLLGRNVFLVEDEDPLCIANAIAKVWHQQLDPETALNEARSNLNDYDLF